MNTLLRLIEYPDTPLYNIKAVVQATAVSSSTLRAWERRYHICHPQRSESGYRLYSERDVVIIQWLSAHVEAGMSISQAVAWLERLAKEAKGLGNVLLPQKHNATPELKLTPAPRHLTQRNYVALQKELLTALLQYNESAAEQLLAEAFSLYPVELVGENLIAPLLVEIGNRWHQGEISITAEHYASNYIIQRLAALLRALPSAPNGTLIWVGCAPDEQHEIGALLLTLYLRRAGYPTQFIGKDLPVEDVVAEVQRRRPSLVLFSASRPETVPGLERLTALLTGDQQNHALVGYGGRVFHEYPELRQQINATYLGNTAYEAVANVHALLSSSHIVASKGRADE